MLEIVETPTSPTLWVTTALIALFFVIALVWSYIGHVDIIATAPGKVIARTRTKVVQAYEAGVVRAIDVAEGDSVKRGQVLTSLDPTISAADRARYADLLAQARLHQARLKSELAPSKVDPFERVIAPRDLIAAARAHLASDQRSHRTR